MDSTKILVVEDEPVVARDLQLSLERLGYAVPATASSGEEALRKARDCSPDLVLMDIVLKGRMDGVETAQNLQRQLNIPVVYLTAYADPHTVERAKSTAPLGYLLKPFQPTDLQRTVEVALSRAREDRHLRESLRWLLTMVCCSQEAIITTDRRGLVTYMNSAGETLTGWLQEEATGTGLTTMLSSSGAVGSDLSDNPALRAMAEGTVIDLDDVVLVGRDGRERAIQGSAASVSDECGRVLGAVLSLRERLVAVVPSGQNQDATPLSEEFHSGTTLRGVINLCAWCKRVPNRDGTWYDLDTFIAEHSGVLFNGGLCPECLDRCFPRDLKPPMDIRTPWSDEGDPPLLR